MILPPARIARISRAMLAAVLAAIVAGLCIFAPKIVWGASPELAAAGSFFLPGLGQAANSDYGKAGLHFGSALVLASQYSIQVEKEDYILPADRVDNKNKEIDINRTSYEADLWGSALFNLSLYSSFAAYRDGRQAISNQGYETPAPGEKAYPDLKSVPVPIDMVDVFRRSELVKPVIDEAIEVGVKYIWLQDGVIDEESKAKAEAAGIPVVMDD